jgi:hypothetical protein
MLKYKSGLVALLVIMFVVPSLATAKQDREQVLLSPIVVGEDTFCFASNVGSETSVDVHITVIDLNGVVVNDETQPVLPGASVFTASPSGLFPILRRCEIEWFGQPGDLLGSACGHTAHFETTTLNDGVTCMPMR